MDSINPPGQDWGPELLRSDTLLGYHKTCDSAGAQSMRSNGKPRSKSTANPPRAARKAPAKW